MEKFLNTHFVVSVHLVIIALVITVGVFALHNAKHETKLLLESNIERQLTLMTELIAITDRNGADEVVERIITDCPRRNEFERLLIDLGRSSYRDLLNTQQLFESCGGFYAERKALMVSRLEREYEVLKDNVALIHALDSNTDTEYGVEDWGELIELEQKRSDLLSEQLVIQRDIIKLLIEGETVASSQIIELVNDASKVNDSLGVVDKQIDALRGQFINYDA